MKSALVVQGGWQGHEPAQIAEVLANTLRDDQFHVTISDTLESLADADRISALDLIIPIWTMGRSSGRGWRDIHGAHWSDP